MDSIFDYFPRNKCGCDIYILMLDIQYDAEHNSDSPEPQKINDIVPNIIDLTLPPHLDKLIFY